VSKLAQKSGKLRKIALRRRHAIAPDDDIISNQRSYMPLAVGCIVRVYYDEETFDEGEVKSITETHVQVDFYDWIEQWNSASQFMMVDLYLEAISVWVPTVDGEITVDFRLTNQSKLV
jgi:hypothetical protein